MSRRWKGSNTTGENTEELCDLFEERRKTKAMRLDTVN